MRGVPFIHGVQPRIRGVDGNDRPLCQGVQVAVGNDGGYFNDHVLIGFQSGHFQINPDQVAGTLHGVPLLSTVWPQV